MFEKDSTLIRYIRENYTMAEKIYEGYMIMRKVVGDIENIKYDNPDKMAMSEEFKQGFIAGVKCLSAILMDM